MTRLDQTVSLPVSAQLLATQDAHNLVVNVKATLSLLWHAATSVALGCSTDYDCSLNGVCTSSVCVCDDGWRGVTCGQLNLLAPAAISPAYVPLNGTSWGGSVVRGPQRNYHMFVAEMANGCGMQTWATNSVIRHAVAVHPEGPYAAAEVVMPPFAHNPTAIRAPDGTYLIYHIGCGTLNKGIAPCTDCANGVTGKTCKGTGESVACNATTTNILFSQSLDGPWSQLNARFIASTTMGSPYQIDNPTVLFFQNGSLLMLGRGGNLKDESESDGVITAPSWKGPYTMHTMVGNASSPRVEDPFVWQDNRENFHALFHKFTDEHPSAGGHAFSSDGFTWTLTNEAAYTTEIRLADGTSATFFRRERPHLLFDAATGTHPTMLFTALTNWGATNDSALTFAQAIGASRDD